MTGRVSTRPTSVAGLDLPEGAQVVTLLAGANRDPRVFADPDRYDVTRENARDHVSFSGGRHYCLGASLTRMRAKSASGPWPTASRTCTSCPAPGAVRPASCAATKPSRPACAKTGPP
jgi:Cytochrome P450